ncbi:MAG: heavy-metal-associated domain-containing protein [Burkholderiales bacterium]
MFGGVQTGHAGAAQSPQHDQLRTCQMVAFEVRDMYSSRSAGAIVKSVKALDSGAQVRVDLAARSVEIESERAPLHELRDAIGRAGFTPVAVVQRAAAEADSEPPGTHLPKITFNGTVDLLLGWD